VNKRRSKTDFGVKIDLESDHDVKDSGLFFEDDDRQDERVWLARTLTHEERADQRVHRQHPLFGFASIQVLMKEPVRVTTHCWYAVMPRFYVRLLSK